MAIIRNIPTAIRVYGSLRLLTKYKKAIKKYREEGNLEKERENILMATSVWGKQVVKDIRADVAVTGRENIPDNGPVVFVSNHQSFADIPVLVSILDKFQTGFVAKQSLEKLPLYGQWADLVRCVFILRESPRESLKAMKKGIEYIEQGFSMAIFPEGTRSRGGKMAEFKKGSMKLATIPGVPIVPIALNGTYAIYEETGVFKKAKVEVKILPPVNTKDISKEEEKELASTLENLIRENVEEMQQRMEK